MLELRRENCYYNIKNANKLIDKVLNVRKGKVEKRTCILSSTELADISAEFGLRKFLGKTDIVRLIYKLREEDIDRELKNTYLYRSL